MSQENFSPRVIGSLQKFSANKYLFFALLGLAGGLAGSLISEPVHWLGNPLPSSVAGSAFYLIVSTAAFSAVFSSVIAFALMLAERIYRRHKQSVAKMLLSALAAGVLAGVVGGGLAQLLFGLVPNGWFTQIFVRTFSWGLMGTVVGCGISRVIPNMKLVRGALGGFCGGVLGGIGFILMLLLFGELLKLDRLVGAYFAELIARLAGIGVLGLALGLAVVLAERLFQQASMEIIWAPRQTSRITLGEKPVTIGARGDDVVIAGLGPNTASVVLAGGNVQYIDNKTGKRTDLKNGSKLTIGPVQLVIHAEKDG